MKSCRQLARELGVNYRTVIRRYHKLFPENAINHNGSSSLLTLEVCKVIEESFKRIDPITNKVYMTKYKPQSIHIQLLKDQIQLQITQNNLLETIVLLLKEKS